MTAAALARRIGRQVALVERVLTESVLLGDVERVGGGFRLTERAEHRHGRALRGIGDAP